MSNPIDDALAVATRQWHAAHRTYEHASRAFADAQTQLQHAERDLHELARAIELNTAHPTPAAQGITLAPNGTGGAPIPSDGLDAAQIVLEEMQRMRMGG